jgi:hypothetical protein
VLKALHNVLLQSDEVKRQLLDVGVVPAIAAFVGALLRRHAIAPAAGTAAAAITSTTTVTAMMPTTTAAAPTSDSVPPSDASSGGRCVTRSVDDT